ncbi:anaerobic ribonucleoside-triphosphate reductase activating protein [Clostridium sp. HBUAS56017]|uniref:anaerobic ribonucleoside-triphosphate reductase activating protein n=1 Tax=Clostridium sp. HBUAS56017 TaxID=2571128 RepID=UPI0011781F33|nr:anaerobic ribonucleoside-triphosphate reductase activating protein [Clostridium sp. HBUAS56017]
MKYAEIRKFDVSNGPNVRTTLFVTGCTNDCEGCFNKDLQSFNHGNVWSKDLEEKFISYVKNPNVYGVNILGGEPMEQTMDSDLFDLLTRVKKETGKTIWLWSGYTFQQIMNDDKKKKILSLVDVLIDGRFEISKRNISLKYRGSENQRVIDAVKSMKENRVVLIEKI